MFSFPVSRISTAIVVWLMMASHLMVSAAEFSAQKIDNTLYLGNMLTTDKADDWQSRFWGLAYGNWDHRQIDTNVTGFRADTFGLIAGLHRKRNSRLTWGWSAGGSWISANNDANSGYKNIDGFKTMFDAALDSKDWRLITCAGFGYNSQSIQRHDYYGVFSGENNAQQWGVGTEFQLKVNSGPFEMEPYARFDVMTLSEKGYTEHRISGIGLPQSFGKTSDESIATTLGVRYRWRQTGHLAVWRPELTAAWCHEFGSDDLFRSSRLDPFPTFYTFPGSNNQRDHLLFGFGIVAHFGSTMDLFARYTTDIAGDYTANTIHVGTNWKF